MLHPLISGRALLQHANKRIALEGKLKPRPVSLQTKQKLQTPLSWRAIKAMATNVDDK